MDYCGSPRQTAGRERALSSQSNVDDSEYQHALEVIFYAQNAQRRKSSLVSGESPDLFLSRKLNADNTNQTTMESFLLHSINNLGGVAESILKSESSQADRTTSQSFSPPEVQPIAPQIQEQQAVNSRHLSKKQLSEMAWGVRELSKRLGNIRLKLKARNLFLLTKPYDVTMIEFTREIARWLLRPERLARYTVWIESYLKDNKIFDSKGLLEELQSCYNRSSQSNSISPNGGVTGNDESLETRLRYWDSEMCRKEPQRFDFVITLGGDGTVLYASWLFQRIVPPVLSFALGSLGFLTKFDYSNYQDILENAFKDGVTISLRLRLEGTIMRSKPIAGRNSFLKDTDDNHGKMSNAPQSRDLVEELVNDEEGDEQTHRPDGSYEILNDIVVDRGPNPTMSSIELFSDNQHMTSIAADGICVATPTGSTAYNLAAGGSLCHPDNPVILLTAICAHTLSFRPIILPDTVVLRLGVPFDARTGSWASFDGRERVELRPGDYITISASRYPFASVMQPNIRNEDWSRSISEKLGWNIRQRQKAYKE